jgi:predicted signal transduction protein with EAL and GGDEF domain
MLLDFQVGIKHLPMIYFILISPLWVLDAIFILLTEIGIYISRFYRLDMFL